MVIRSSTGLQFRNVWWLLCLSLVLVRGYTFRKITISWNCLDSSTWYSVVDVVDWVLSMFDRVTNLEGWCNRYRELHWEMFCVYVAVEIWSNDFSRSVDESYLLRYPEVSKKLLEMVVFMEDLKAWTLKNL